MTYVNSVARGVTASEVNQYQRLPILRGGQSRSALQRARYGPQLNREIMLTSTAYDLAISLRVSPAARRLSASWR